MAIDTGYTIEVPIMTGRRARYYTKSYATPKAQMASGGRSRTWGAVEFNGSKDNSIIWNGVGFHNFAPFRDTNPACKPEAQCREGRSWLPAIIFVHGGGWKRGTHHDYRSATMRMAGRGFVTATVEYRLAGESRGKSGLAINAYPKGTDLVQLNNRKGAASPARASRTGEAPS